MAGGNAVGPAEVSRILIGNRRAAQLLRLLDEGDTAGADEVLKKVGPIADWVFIDANFASMRRVSRTGPDDQAVTAELKQCRDAAVGDRDALRTWLYAAAGYTIERLKMKWPKAQDRATYYRIAAQSAFDAEEPGSFARRVLFGQDNDAT